MKFKFGHHAKWYMHKPGPVLENSSSSPCCTASTDLPDILQPPISIVHCPPEVFKATSCSGTDLLYIGSNWSPMWRGPQEYVACEFVPTSPAVFCMSDSSNLDSFCDGW